MAFILRCAVACVFLSLLFYFGEGLQFSPVTSIRSVICEGGRAQCPDLTTCCIMSSGSFGCCPMPNAVCCYDGVHCCAEGTVCSEETQSCVKNGLAMPWYSKLPPKPIARSKLVMDKPDMSVAKAASSERIPETNSLHQPVVTDVRNVICPDKQSQCPDGTTCCMLSSGKYGCCPLQNAVCCSDHIHCCPSGTTCDVSKGTCDREEDSFSVPWFTKLPSQPVVTDVTNVICPDKQSQCPDGTTCCMLSSGKYGCCPLPNAVCCSDHIHCCPSGTTCDVSKGTCDREEDSFSVPWFTKLVSQPVRKDQPVSNGVSSVICPDKQSQCPDGTTCCILASGQYGCCPLPNAVCCSDHIHCCPSGTTCDVSKGTCDREEDSFSVTWFTKLASQPVVTDVRNVICPDKQSQCPDGTTCCMLSSGKYGCCPLPNAVCCSDHIHCCPSGTTCDVSKGTCDRGLLSLPWLDKEPSLPILKDVVCPGGTSTCPDNQTCCMLASGKYGCCPLPHAVCCSDHLHCCPQATTCDTSHGRCTRSDGTYITWSHKVEGN